MIDGVADTHAALWYVFGDSRLSAPAKSVFETATSSRNKMALSYTRYFQRIPESTDSPRPRRWRPLPVFAAIARNPVERACYFFAIRALLRSESHNILFGGFLGLGLVTAAQMLLDGATLAAPLCVAYLLIVGMRFAFELPAGQAANWVFRLILNGGKREARQAARKLMLTFMIPLVFVPTLVFQGLLPCLFVAGLSLFLGEVMLVRFRKVPFTSALPNLQNHAIVVILIYVLGFWIFAVFAAALERWMLLSPIRFVCLSVFLAAAWGVLRSIQAEAEEIGDDLVFEAAAAREVQTLNLTGR